MGLRINDASDQWCFGILNSIYLQVPHSIVNGQSSCIFLAGLFGSFISKKLSNKPARNIQEICPLTTMCGETLGSHTQQQKTISFTFLNTLISNFGFLVKSVDYIFCLTIIRELPKTPLFLEYIQVSAIQHSSGCLYVVCH